MIPWFERPIIYDVRLRPQQISSATGTRDLQTVNITLRVLSRPIPNKLPQVYRSLGMNYEQRVLPSIITETLKSVIAQYNASQLLTMREAVSAEVMRKLKTRAAYFNIEMDDVSIKELTFGKDYTQAVESKQVAQQEVRVWARSIFFLSFFPLKTVFFSPFFFFERAFRLTFSLSLFPHCKG